MFYEHDGLIRFLPYRCAGTRQLKGSQEELDVPELTAGQYVIFRDVGG